MRTDSHAWYVEHRFAGRLFWGGEALTFVQCAKGEALFQRPEDIDFVNTSPGF